MPKLFQINVTLNMGSTGRIAEQIGNMAKSKGWDVWIAHGPRFINPSVHHSYQVCSSWEEKLHALKSRLFDGYGLGCTSATKRLVKKIEEVKPDIIHLHNIHGYYLDIRVLFDYLKTSGIPVVWTLHDCWSFTGHCPHFELVGCDKWKTGCHNCPQKKEYPKCLLFDNSNRNFEIKRKYFTSIDNLTIVPVSKWLTNLVQESFFQTNNKIKIKTIYNGIDLNTFTKTQEGAEALRRMFQIEHNNKIVLFVASRWVESKGYSDIFQLRKLMPDDYTFVMLGVNDEQMKELPEGIIGIKRTESQQEMSMLYVLADVYVNPTYADTFPTVNLEALACGTPVVTYRTGGSPEAIDENTGIVVEKGDIDSLAKACIYLCENSESMSAACRERAEKFFDKNKCFKEYVQLYEELLK